MATTGDVAAVPRPRAWEERMAPALLYAFSPGRPRRVRLDDPSDDLRPFERFHIPRSNARGSLSATWFPAAGDAAPRGAVLLLHPAIEAAQSFLWDRIAFLRDAGYAALTFDLAGYGESPLPDRLWDRDVVDALAALEARAPGVPTHAWGVSVGGYGLMMALANGASVTGAVFEATPTHLYEYAEEIRPYRRIPQFALRAAFPGTTRFINMRAHAPRLAAERVAVIAAALDRGNPVPAQRHLAALAGGRVLVVPDAKHLEVWKKGRAIVEPVVRDVFG